MISLLILRGCIFTLVSGVFLVSTLELLIVVLVLIYSSSMVIVHYNIVLEDQNILESSMQNDTIYKPIKADIDTTIVDLPPPYSQVI